MVLKIIKQISFIGIIMFMPVYTYSLETLTFQEQMSQDLIRSLPGYGIPKSNQYSGYLKIKTPEKSSSMYYYLATANEESANTPLILWLNGGPGSSSFYGLFTENGPYRIQADLKLKENPSAWSTKYNFLIFDQPIGVGYSFPDKNYQIKNEAQTTHELYLAILAFYKKFPYLQRRKLYIAGESYAGRYIPEVADEILRQNKASNLNKIPLAGIILGDAWVNPLLQQSQDADYAYAHGLIDYNGKKIVDDYYEECAKAIQSEKISSKATNAKCGQMGDFIRKQSGIDLHNIHNVMRNESANTYTNEYDALANYLNQKEVKRALHVSSLESFNLYSSFVGNALEVGEQNSVATLIPKVLEQNVAVLVLNGLNDAKDCNFMGTSLWLQSLNWQKFNQASQKQLINQDGEIMGYVTNYKNLTYVKVLSAGHMIPEDQPANSLEIIDRFIQHGYISAN